ncbi:MAG: YqaJ viral recombinase family protein [Ruminococcus sp.]|nr:YqaJ viral recombinase family protein [Ruminococcus sp.]
MILKPENREEWLKLRLNGIGGSDAGTVIGVNKYKTNVQLWEEKTGITVPEDISDKPAVNFGKHAEPHLRELFRLDYQKEYDLDYHEFYMYVNDSYPFIFATLDGELTDKGGKKGILEIKTVTIQNAMQWAEWEDKIPDTYYAQILHQLAATGWEFAILRAYIRYYKNGVLKVTMRKYTIERNDVQADIDYLIQRESAFWKDVTRKTRPALILLEI